MAEEQSSFMRNNKKKSFPWSRQTVACQQEKGLGRREIKKRTNLSWCWKEADFQYFPLNAMLLNNVFLPISRSFPELLGYSGPVGVLLVVRENRDGVIEERKVLSGTWGWNERHPWWGSVHQRRSASLVSMRRLAQAAGIEAGVGTAGNWRCCLSFSSFQFHCLFRTESAPESRHKGPGHKALAAPCWVWSGSTALATVPEGWLT